MTIQKTTVQFRNKIYDVILEDGLVSYIDPKRPELRKSFGQNPESKITSMEGAKKMALQMISKRLMPRMSFSD